MLCMIGSLGTACKKGYFDINENPNSPTSVPAKFLLPTALVNSARQLEGGNQDFANYWMGYWAVSAGFGADANLLTYNVTTNFATGNWLSNYITLRNYKDMITQGTNDSTLINFRAISRVMWAHHFMHIVDLYGNAIYTDYGNYEQNLFPGYDDAQSIYLDLLVQLDGAIADVEIGTEILATKPSATEDLVFAGNMENWKKFANNLKLKILLHMSNKTDLNSIVTQGLNSIDQAIGFYLEDVKLNPGYNNGNSASQNPRWSNVGFAINGEAYGNRNYVRANAYAVNYLSSKADGRLSYIYDLNNAGTIKGRVFGSNGFTGETNTEISPIGGSRLLRLERKGVLKDEDMDSYLMPAYQIDFLLAEAYQRGLLTGDAKIAYEAGINASFSLLGAPELAFGTIIGYANFDNAVDKLDAIYRQAWIAGNTYDAFESYTTWRRTGYPKDIPVSIYPGTNTEHIPYRLAYPLQEYSFNAQNVEAQGTINPLSTKIFWMP